jgi:hypothetical protein
MPVKEAKPRSRMFPSTIDPVTGFGRSSTTKGMPRSAAACIASDIVEM